MPEGYEEADLRKGLREGGTILQVFIVIRPPRPKAAVAPTPEDVEFVAYFRTSWRRGYHILRTYKHRNDKIYLGRGLGRLVWLIQEEFGHKEPLVLHRAGSSALQRFAGLQPIDRGNPAEEDSGSPRAAPEQPPWEWPVRYPPRDRADLPSDTGGSEEGAEE